MTDTRKITEVLNTKLQSELCEIMPSVCEDSGQTEWTVGELQKMIDKFWEIVTPAIKTYGNEQREKATAELSEAKKEVERLKQVKDEIYDDRRDRVCALQNEIDKYESAVRLMNEFIKRFAVGKRNDGTYNYSREACEHQAKELLTYLSIKALEGK